MLKYKLLLLSFIFSLNIYGQESIQYSFNIGAPAPRLRVRKWLKGPSVKGFEKGKVYVVDFGATWCRPCIVSMPHLSALADKYKGEVTFLAIDVYEDRNTTIPSDQDIKHFVDSMGREMNFPVALDDSDFMVYHWLKASNTNSIPNDFVVNADGKIAWIGNPSNLDSVLFQIFNNS